MNKVCVYQIDCKSYLLKSIGLPTTLAEISAFVDAALATESKMLQFHKAYGYKNYVVSGFKELEEDKCYKEGKIYTFSVRCVDKQLCNFLTQKLKDVNTESMKGLVASNKIISKCLIDRIYSITPVITKIPKVGYWKGNISLEQYEKLLFENAIKKYNQLTGEKVNEDFQLYSQIRFLNKKPIGSNYKGIQLLGDKIELCIAENETAQEIAYMLLGVGLFNNNARGYGYLNYKAL